MRCATDGSELGSLVGHHIYDCGAQFGGFGDLLVDGAGRALHHLDAGRFRCVPTPAEDPAVGSQFQSHHPLRDEGTVS